MRSGTMLGNQGKFTAAHFLIQEKKNHDEFIFRTYHYVLLVEVIAPRIVPEVNFIKVCVPDLAHDTTAVLPLSVLRHHLFTDI